MTARIARAREAVGGVNPVAHGATAHDAMAARIAMTGGALDVAHGAATHDAIAAGIPPIGAAKPGSEP